MMFCKRIWYEDRKSVCKRVWYFLTVMQLAVFINEDMKFEYDCYCKRRYQEEAESKMGSQNGIHNTQYFAN